MKSGFIRHAVAAAVIGVVGLSSGYAATAHDQHDTGVKYRPDVTFTLRTDIADGKLVFVGEAGAIKGKVNPQLAVVEGAIVQINLVNGDGATHDISVPDFKAASNQLNSKGASTTIVFKADKKGEFKYICTLPGHVQAGMIGQILVGDGGAKPKATGVEVSRSPMETGQPVGARGPQSLTVNLETTEVLGQLADGTTYKYWTFNSKVPGPFIRVRQGDTVTVNMANAIDSKMIHSVDFHAVTGPGGGAAVTQAAPGSSKSFTFKAINPGLFVYHCATPMVAQHISNGMYGMILVEPAGGLPKVDREFYVMQGELYTSQPHGTLGENEFSLEKLLKEQPEHMMFNGTMDALTKTHRMEAKVGETVRIFFGVGGPNATSSFHVIGEVFDRVFSQADLTSAPLKNIQTISVPPGGASMVEFKVEVPGRYILVDHALSRLEKGLAGFLYVTGPENPQVFSTPEKMRAGSGH
ncbi:copper-containing nitrite reductase [Polaromonas sp.]|jgi:nitrite reductase (NO-forming)|uniref:copper-containing nitrite reductase n=1 Tax=Polaromonas sp. TaxID=1869339 RepID=UPI002C8AF31B|nr:copper-containing nitrite reductase [Polaromonas sp.]HQS31339.1 copper-containing nitrite reductase [Polaromonas sp.]HQS90640.1 copper-containing nitrite reductase [Polaromonas sp.]